MEEIMKKIEFGFSNDFEPTGSWEGIGIREGLLLTEADYYGAVEAYGKSYVVAKVTRNEYRNFPSLVGKFLVRDALVDVYADGSSVLYLDQEMSLEAQELQSILNVKQERYDINSADDVVACCEGVHEANKLFKLVAMDDRIISTSIAHDAFVVKREAIANCNRSMSAMQRSLSAGDKSVGFYR